MSARINRAIELLSQDQAIYYMGHHTGHDLSFEAGKNDAQTWADYINIGMEHGAFDLGGLEQYMRGLVEGGPTKSGHRTPTVVVEVPVNGLSEEMVRHNAWQMRQLLGRGVHGLLLCQAETVGAVRAFVESARYPHHLQGVDPELPTPMERMKGKLRHAPGKAGGRVLLDIGMRGRGSEQSAAPVWGLSGDEYMERADPWPLNPKGELMLGLKLESPEGIAMADELLAVPGLAFAEMGPGDLSLSLGSVKLLRDPYPPEMQAARDKVFQACKRNGIAFLEGSNRDNIVGRLNEGVRVIGGHDEELANIGRKHQKRTMPY